MRKRYLFYSLALASVPRANAKTPSIPTHDGETIEETDSVKRAKTRSQKTRTAVNCVRKGVVVDAETGEVIQSSDELDDEPADIDSDMGFDPYMGCFSDDC